MTMLFARRVQHPSALGADPAPPRAGQLGTPLDLVHLARQSLGDKEREMEILGCFAHQADLAALRLRAQADSDSARAMVKMLGAAARTAGVFGVGAACDAYVATLGGCLPERDAARALEILEEEIAIARAAISDLASR